jgi:hypothetical protein
LYIDNASVTLVSDAGLTYIGYCTGYDQVGLLSLLNQIAVTRLVGDFWLLIEQKTADLII